MGTTGIVSGLPAGLASMTPGAGLAVLLASVDRSAVGGAGLPDLVAARARLAANTEAELLADLWEAAQGILTDPHGGAGRCGEEEVIEAAARVLGWVLHCSESYAQARVMLGRALVVRLPMVLAALRAGHIDAGKARVIVEALAAVADDQLARLIATKVLRKAPVQTLAQVRAGLRYHIDRHDPGSARRRYRKAVTRRGVFLRGNDDGTADLTVANLAPHRAAQAYDRVDRVARCARAGGDGRNLAQLRADAAADLLAGVPFQRTPTVDAVTHEADTTEAVPDETVDPPGWAGSDVRFPDPDGGGRGRVWAQHGPLDPPLDPPGRSVPADRTHPGLPWWPEDPAEPDPAVEVAGRVDLYDYDQWCLTDEDRWWTGYRDEPSGAAGTSDEDPTWWTTATPTHPHRRDGHAAAAADADADTDAEAQISCFASAKTGTPLVLSAQLLPGDRCGCGGVLTGVRAGGVDVAVNLSTLIGLDERPGLIAGLDTPLSAELARHIAHDPQTRPVWRWSVFDQHGDLLHHGTTRPNPAAAGRNSCFETAKPAAVDERMCTCARVEPAARRSSIEVQLTPATLERLLHDPGLARGYEQVIADIAGQVADDRRTNPPGKWSEVDEHGRLRDHGHTGRMPHAAEAAFIRARDRTCRAPGCPVPSSRCELDHRIEHARGGPSHRGCVDARCKRHHHLRHRAGFRISKRGRTTTWTIPNGRTFDVTTDKDLILTEDDQDLDGPARSPR